MSQTRWYSFAEMFEVPVDRTPWDGRYHKGRPCRDRFSLRGSVFGLRRLADAPDGLDFGQLSGVYLIGYNQTPIYVGHARGKESIMSRLGKHRIKLTGSDGGSGIYHPTRWQEFVTRRYFENPALIQNDTLGGFSFSAFVMTRPSLHDVKILEGRVYRVVSDVIGRARMLNSPHRVKRVEPAGMAVNLE